MMFVKFTEINEHEGETWTFWLQRDGNEAALAQLADALDEFGGDEYHLADTALREDVVDVLVEHGGVGYRPLHTKVTGHLEVPTNLLAVDEDSGDVLQDGLYKGGVQRLFRNASTS